MAVVSVADVPVLLLDERALAEVPLVLDSGLVCKHPDNVSSSNSGINKNNCSPKCPIGRFVLGKNVSLGTPRHVLPRKMGIILERLAPKCFSALRFFQIIAMH